MQLDTMQAIETGAKVFLRICRFGKPGTVLRIERRKLVVYWRDLDFIGRHRAASLVLAEETGDQKTNITKGK